MNMLAKKTSTFDSPISVYPLWWPSLTKDMQTEQLLCWSGMTHIEHSTASSSNEEEVHFNCIFPSIKKEIETKNDKRESDYPEEAKSMIHN